MLLQLIKKDILLTWKYLLLMGALCCFYPFFVHHQISGAAAAFAGTLAFILMTFFSILFALLQAFQKEAMYPKASAYLCALPYRRRDLVLAKYIYFLGVYLGCCLIYWLETLILPDLGGFGLSEAVPIFAAVSLLLGLYLPVQYRFGYEFTKYFFMFAILGISFLLPMFIKYLPPELLSFRIGPGLLAALFLSSLGLLAASAAASVYFYKKAELA
mgnify:CR=1 FL=1